MRKVLGEGRSRSGDECVSLVGGGGVSEALTLLTLMCKVLEESEGGVPAGYSPLWPLVINFFR